MVLRTFRNCVLVQWWSFLTFNNVVPNIIYTVYLQWMLTLDLAIRICTVHAKLRAQRHAFVSIRHANITGDLSLQGNMMTMRAWFVHINVSVMTGQGVTWSSCTSSLTLTVTLINSSRLWFDLNAPSNHARTGWPFWDVKCIIMIS